MSTLTSLCPSPPRFPQGGWGGLGSSLGNRPPGVWWGTVFPGWGRTRGGEGHQVTTQNSHERNGGKSMCFSVTMPQSAGILPPFHRFGSIVLALFSVGFSLQRQCMAVVHCVQALEVSKFLDTSGYLNFPSFSHRILASQLFY